MLMDDQPVKVLLWDFDGTLAARDGMWTGTLVEVANLVIPERGITKDDIRPFLQEGFPWHTADRPHPNQTPDEWWAALIPVFVTAYAGVGLSPELARALAARVRAAFLEVSQWRVFDDVLPTLSSLQGLGWTHYILSNHVPELPSLAHALGLSPFFEEVLTSARTGFEKPHPEAFKGLLRQLPGGSTVWMVGDSLAADVQGAANVGLPAILVRRKHDGARYYCESLAGVEGIVSTQPIHRLGM